METNNKNTTEKGNQETPIAKRPRKSNKGLLLVYGIIILILLLISYTFIQFQPAEITWQEFDTKMLQRNAV